MKKMKLLYYCISIFTICFSMTVFATNIEHDIGINIDSATFCNVFERTADKVFYMDLYNKTLDDVSVELEERVLDHTGETVWSSNETVDVNAESRIFEAVVPKIDNNGIYTLEVLLKQNNNILDEFSGQFYITEIDDTVEGYGVCTHLQTKDKVEELDLLEYLNFDMIRDEAMWDYVEREKGKYVIPERIQRYVDYAYQNGIEILMPLTYGNSLYMETAGQMPYTDEQITAYVNYCKFIASHFKGKVKYFEIWNEPNVKNFNPDGRTATDYAKLLKAAYAGIKSVNDEAVVIGGVCATSDGVQDYYEELNEAGAYDAMDVVSIHPYSCFGKKLIDEDGLDFDWVENLLGKYNKPIWVTEIGYYSEPKFTEEEQAVYEARTAVLFSASQKVEKVFFYDLQNDGEDKTNLEHNFGKITLDHRVKPTFVAIATATNLIGNAECVESKRENEYSLFKFQNKADDEDIYAMWTRGKRESGVNVLVGDKFNAEMTYDTINLTIDSKDKQMYFVDCYGKETEIHSGDTFELDYKPAYILCR